MTGQIRFLAMGLWQAREVVRLEEKGVYHSIKVAAISMKPTKWDKAGNADKLEALFVEAATDHPQVIVAPEGMFDGYPVMDVIRQPQLAEKMFAIAEPMDGPYIQRFQRLARRLKVCLCFGFAELVADEIYNCGVFIDHQGAISGKYHKTQFAEGVHPSWTFNRIGKALRAFDTPLGRAGIFICNDRWNPHIARTLVLDGARVLFNLAWGERSKASNAAILARARENGVPVVQANVGVSLIVSKGEVVAYRWGVDQITHAVIDIPQPPSQELARRSEEAFLHWQQHEMERRHRDMMDDLSKGIKDRIVRYDPESEV
jgi:predicted amidohydrolase